ncbi:response regulator transcription factor [Chengkuizengella marina]|uniref:Response regulator transcription factor n=1 Tax=Chengkuizengella marina TaxID=2507566 RepID=A0A6N9Q4N7_9BACL|nr:response regulator transcription factor [Chengkuizengella marina]NBI29796.1 response regulator transcription factor [Chengkuizengella marina]
MYRVFLVDDEPFIVEGMKSIIHWEDYGLQVIGVAYDGKQALQALENLECDLLITDIMMPNMNGLDLIKVIKQRNQDMKFIVATGYQEFQYVKKGISLGIENYLLKPIDEGELISTLRNAIEKLDKAKHDDEDSYILRDNSIWRWLNQDISNQEFIDRLELYGMAPFINPLVVAILQVEFDQTTQKGSFSELRRWIESCFSCICVLSPEQEFILIWSGIEVSHVQQHVKHLQAELRKHKKLVQFFIALGSEANSIEEIFSSFYRVKELRTYRFVLPENTHVITETLTQNYLQTSNLMIDYNFQDLVNHVLNGDLDGAMQWVDQAFQRFVEVISVDIPKLSKGFAVKLLSIVLNAIESQIDLNVFSEMVTRIMHTNTIEELKQVMNQFIIETFDNIERHNQQMSPIIKSVLQYVHEHLHKELSLKTLSQRFHVNTNYLGQLFQKEVGTVFSDHINHLRIEKAKKLLKLPQYKVGEIGKMVGYSDPTYFYKQFKKSIGLTPTEWRSKQV